MLVSLVFHYTGCTPEPHPLLCIHMHEPHPHFAAYDVHAQIRNCLHLLNYAWKYKILLVKDHALLYRNKKHEWCLWSIPNQITVKTYLVGEVVGEVEVLFLWWSDHPMQYVASSPYFLTFAVSGPCQYLHVKVTDIKHDLFTWRPLTVTVYKSKTKC